MVSLCPISRIKAVRLCTFCSSSQTVVSSSSCIAMFITRFAEDHKCLIRKRTIMEITMDGMIVTV